MVAMTIAMLAVTAMHWRQRDVSLCRRVLSGLAQGKPWVQRDVAWDRFAAMGNDVGTVYQKLPNDGERLQYRMAFVQRFADGFQRAQANVDNFGRWRIVAREPGRTIVATDCKPTGSTLQFQISTNGPHRVEAIQWQ